MVRPQSYSPKLAAGMTSARPSPPRSDSQAPASRHWRAMSSNVPRGAMAPDSPGAATTRTTSTPAAATGRRHTRCRRVSAARPRSSACARPIASGRRTRGSALWMLRKATRGPSSSAWASGASGEDTGPRCGTPRSTTPRPRVTRRKRRSGTPLSPSPASETPATSAVARTSSGPVATSYAAGHHSPPEVTTKPSQWVVPRATSRRSISRTTSAARSTQPRNGGDQRPRTTSGPSHHTLAAATRPVHHHVTGLRHHPRRVTSHSPVGTAARIVAVALTPPQPSTARAESAAARRGPIRPCVASTTGRRIAGTRTTGSASDDSPPTVESTRGLRV